MTENRNNTDFKAKYEFLIAGILVILLCLSAFTIYKITGYIKSGQALEGIGTSDENTDGTVLIEVEVRETRPDDGTDETSDELQGDADPVSESISIHDDILVFTTAKAGDNYYKYKSDDGRLILYAEPKDTDGSRPSFDGTTVFEVMGFSRNGWAAVKFGGERYFVKSADIVKTEAPADASDEHTEPEDTQGIRFFTPSAADDIEYVVSMNTRAFSLPDVMSSGNYVDLQEGERVIVVAKGGNWFKIIYMNAEYYVLSYLTPREVFIEENPDVEIADNTGYAPAGSADAASSAAAAGAETAPENSGDSGTGSGDEGSTDGGGSSSGDSSGQSGSGDSSGDTPSVSGSVSYAKELLDMTNAKRAEAGLSPLTWSDTLASCAKARAAELPLLSDSQNSNHQRPNGQPWYTVNGYTDDNSPMYAENIAYGQTSAQEVFNAWIASEGHYKNMMNPDYRTFGAAVFTTDSGYRYYWIEEFGY
ncbi:MAG: CAP domain-containing protein [Clostridiales bacterium]|nr:CAP domain-containing protein [Clostridiales bacterium]